MHRFVIASILAAALSLRADDAVSLQRGAAMAKIHCQRCHLQPDPSLLDKGTWEKWTLPNMAYFLGVQKPELAARPGGKRIEASGIFPTNAVVSVADWKAICDYYVASAPAQALPQDPRPPITRDLDWFEVSRGEYRQAPPLTSLVKILPGRKHFFAADSRTRKLYLLDERGRIANAMDIASPAVQAQPRSDGLWLTLIGSVGPNDEPQGSFVRIATGTPDMAATTILGDLQRPTDVVMADLNQDMKPDLLVCGFGNILGSLSWHENKGEAPMVEHVLSPRPGAVRAYVQDFNQDGLPDVLALMAQAREGLFLYLNKGGGKFEEKVVVETPPVYGFSGLELADMNGDGLPDAITTNGDNGEYPSPSKKYHGVRIYLNEGKGVFKERWFFPLNGAFKALARDFDGDGDLDLAVISFFPDYLKSPEESFVMLENKGGFNFVPRTVPEGTHGRWLTMDAADMDGDGGVDIVLGAFNEGTSPVPKALTDLWKERGPSVLILRNVLKKGSGR